MQFLLRLVLSGAIVAAPVVTHAQLPVVQAAIESASSSSRDQIPDAPDAQWDQQQGNAQDGNNAAQQPAGQQTAQQPSTSGDDAQREKAREQVKEQEGQRVLGVVPAFNISYRSDAVALTSKEKIRLAFRSAVDPFTFGGAVIVAGWGEISDSDNDRGFGWGPAGFAKRSGAKYLDAFNGIMIGNGILPSLLRQDPRYFRLGYGSVTKRTLYALSTAVICKGDRSRRWQPNISNIGGNLAAGAISNLYYPDSNNTGLATTIENGLVVTATGSVGAIFQEFWPDISRKFLHKDPTRGLDAEAAAARAAEKQQQKQSGDPPQK